MALQLNILRLNLYYLFFEFTMNMVFLVTACFLVAGLTCIITHIECEQHPQASLLNVKESIIHLIGPLANSFQNNELDMCSKNDPLKPRHIDYVLSTWRHM